jgi:two-component system LytT family sensor kinase
MPPYARRSRLDHRKAAADSAEMAAARTLLPLRLIFGVATVLGFLSGSQAYYYLATFTDSPAPFALLLALNLSYWYSWALITPAIVWLSKRFPLQRELFARSIPVHLAGVFVATAVHVVLAVSSAFAIRWLFGELGQWTWRSQFQRMFFLNFDWEMMTYWALVGVTHALRYHYEAQDRALRASQLETRLVEAQLQSLQRQMQPHFLFNTLNAISALMHRDVEAADQMIARLSDLLRMSLDMVGTQEVSLKEELDFLAKYVEIEQTRFQDRLSVVYEVQPAALDALVPNLLLQPLVENSIKHGIGPRTGPGRVVIRAVRHERELELEVRDDGVGLSASRLSDFNRGVGLANTRSRLQHLYGVQHRFEFRQPAEGGLTVRIVLPLADAAGEILDGVDGYSEAYPHGRAPEPQISGGMA